MVRWIDDHCHLERDPTRAAAQVAAAREAGRRAPDLGRLRRGPVGRLPRGGPPPPRRRVRHGRGPPARRRRAASTDSRRSWPSPRWWRWGSAASTTSTSTRRATCSARCSPPRSSSPTAHDLDARDPHPGRLGRHVRRARRRGQCPSAPCSTASPGARTRPAGASTSAPCCPSAGSSRSRRLPELQDGRARRARSTACSSRPTAPYLAPVPHRGKKNQPAWVTVVGAAIAAPAGGRRRGGRRRNVGHGASARISSRILPECHPCSLRSRYDVVVMCSAMSSRNPKDAARHGAPAHTAPSDPRTWRAPHARPAASARRLRRRRRLRLRDYDFDAAFADLDGRLPERGRAPCDRVTAAGGLRRADHAIAPCRCWPSTTSAPPPTSAGASDALEAIDPPPPTPRPPSPPCGRRS